MAGARIVEEILERGGGEQFRITVFGDEPLRQLQPDHAVARAGRERGRDGASSSTGTTGTRTTASRCTRACGSARIDRREARRTPPTAPARRTTSWSSPPAAARSSRRSTGVRTDDGDAAARRLRLPHHRRHRAMIDAASTPQRGRRHRRRAARPGGGPRAAGPRAAGRPRARHAVPDEHAARRRGRRDPAARRRDLGIAVHLDVAPPTSSATARVSRAWASPTAASSTCDMVVVAAGVRPNGDSRVRSGLEVERGIVVDDQMRTDDPDVYAVGECAQHRGEVYGLVAPLWEQASVLADVLTGADPTRRVPRLPDGDEAQGRRRRRRVMGVDAPERDDDEFVAFSEPRRGVHKSRRHPRRQARRRDAARRHPQGRVPHPGLRPRAARCPRSASGCCSTSATAPAEVGVAEMRRRRAGLQLQRRHQGRRSAACVRRRRGSVGAVMDAHPRRQGLRLLQVAGQQIVEWAADGDRRARTRRPTGTCPAIPMAKPELDGAPSASRTCAPCPRSSPRSRRAAREDAKVEDGADLAARDGVGRRLRRREGRRVHQRPRPRQHPARRHVLRRPADEGRGHQRRPAAPDRRRRREVRGADGQDHRRPADRPARRPQGGPAGGVGATSACRPATPTARASAP